MITKNEIREARIKAARAAGRRWKLRQFEREDNTRKIIAGGVGAADSLERQMKFSARESTRATAALRFQEGTLPAALERIIGPTIDLVRFAPSEAARKAGRPVARIVVMPSKGIEAEGIATGFMVTPRLLMTNFHVLPSLNSAQGLGANFSHDETEQGVQTGVYFELKPGTFYVSDEHLDFALVAVDSKASDGASIEGFGTIRLIEARPKILNGQPVNIIQHPGGGPKQYAITDNRLLDILEDGFLHYSTDTLPGSSGSPAFNKSWELVALHHSGVPEMRGDEIWSTRGMPWDPEKMNDDEVHWVANEGARVSAIIEKLGTIKFNDSSRQALLDELLQATSDPLEAVARTETSSTSLIPGNNLMANNVFNFTGPVTIRIESTPSAIAVQTNTPTTAQKAAPAVEKVIRFDKDYEAKEGYKEHFLGDGLIVPMPTVSAARIKEIYKDPDNPNDPLLLKYHHFSLVMNKERRLQMWSAVNVDYSEGRRDGRSRKEFGTDKWINDPRIPLKSQITDEEFYKPAGRIDRGHIVRREDNAWGDSPDEIEFGNSDTFHWLNCTPQHEAFNQENARGYNGRKGIWGQFEGYVTDQLMDGDKRCCILAGPALLPKDPSADFGQGKIQYPIHFWKVVVTVEKSGNGAPKLKANGFIFSQADVVKKFGIEFVPGIFAQYQRKLSDITDLTGVEFDQSLHAADTK